MYIFWLIELIICKGTCFFIMLKIFIQVVKQGKQWEARHFYYVSININLINKCM